MQGTKKMENGLYGKLGLQFVHKGRAPFSLDLEGLVACTGRQSRRHFVGLNDLKILDSEFEQNIQARTSQTVSSKLVIFDDLKYEQTH